MNIKKAVHVTKYHATDNFGAAYTEKVHEQNQDNLKWCAIEQ